MALALKPAEFAYGREHTPERPAGDDVWELFGETYRVNPYWLVDDGDRAMVRLWRTARPQPVRIATPMLALLLPAPPGPLPDRGGLNDQAAAMLDAFDLMDEAAAELRAEIERERE